MKYKPYPKYKDTGIEWLGEIPEKWNVVRLRFIFTIKKRIAGSLGYDILSITQQGIKVKDIESNEGQNSQDYSKYQIVDIGDFAMNHMDLLTGFVDISKYFGVTSPDYRVFTLTDTENNDPQYFLQILQMCYLQKIFYPFGQGASQFGRWRLPTDAFRNFWYPVPSISIQKKIVTFLQLETRRIDSLVIDYEELNTLLLEKRQSLISHAVTRGLSELVSQDDPDFKIWSKKVQFKQSGIEWFGEIPQKWELKKIKWSILIHKNGVWGDDPKDDENDIICIRVADFNRLDQSIDSNKLTTRNILSNELNDRCLEYGDLLLEKSGGGDIWPVGYVVLFELPIKAVCSNFIARVKINSECDSTFFKYLHLSLYFKKITTRSINQTSGIQNLDSSNYFDNYVAYPDLIEQKAIARFLNKKTQIIDKLIIETTKSIALLKEHRSALITNVVTGKINVEETA